MPASHLAAVLRLGLVAVALRPLAEQPNARVDADALIVRLDVGIVGNLQAFVGQGVVTQVLGARGLREYRAVLTQPISHR